MYVSIHTLVNQAKYNIEAYHIFFVIKFLNLRIMFYNINY